MSACYRHVWMQAYSCPGCKSKQKVIWYSMPQGPAKLVARHWACITFASTLLSPSVDVHAPVKQLAISVRTDDRSTPRRTGNRTTRPLGVHLIVGAVGLQIVATPALTVHQL